MVDIFIYNPSDSLIEKIHEFVKSKGFVPEESELNTLRYRKGSQTIDIEICVDHMGRFVIILCDNVVRYKIRRALAACPECGSKQIRPSIALFWRNEEVERLYNEGKIDYGVGAYDRMGTQPPNNRCLECGCTWHNHADTLYFSDVVKNGHELTESVIFQNFDGDEDMNVTVFQVVKGEIDKWNPYGLLPEAPEDEFDNESKAISKRISADSSIEDIARVISEEFTSEFEKDYFNVEHCMLVAEKIHIKLVGGKQ